MPPSPALPTPWWLASYSLWRREMVRFFRQKHRVASVVLTPLLLWLLLGLGFSRSFRPPDADVPPAGLPSLSYLQYFLPGSLLLVLLTSSVFSNITLIEDRREGFLQAVLASPAPRLGIVLGKVLGGATVAWAQGVLFLLLWPWVAHAGPPADPAAWLASLALALRALAVLFLLAVQLTAWGLCLAWPLDSASSFHALMMLVLMPLWFLSGAVFPLNGAPDWLRGLMSGNPLTYSQQTLWWALTGAGGAAGSPAPDALALALTSALTAAAVLLALWLVTRARSGGEA